ncbi:MAG: hypothetical protein IT379_33490, partial [Deltaproteobacteria bacterium]|nr:hypothetical protein [Deltaproteobacteria bacterium]
RKSCSQASLECPHPHPRGAQSVNAHWLRSKLRGIRQSVPDQLLPDLLADPTGFRDGLNAEQLGQEALRLVAGFEPRQQVAVDSGRLGRG